MTRNRPRTGLLLAALLALACGCAEDDKGIAHPTDRLHYPVAVAADPSGEYIYVVNSNFDVRYDSGAVIAIDLNTHMFVPESAATVGHFGGEIVLYETGEHPHRLVGYVPGRSDGVLSWFYITGGVSGVAPELKCQEEHYDDPAAASPEDGIQVCANPFSLTSVFRPRLPRDDAGLTDEEAAELADEPVRMEVGRNAYGATVYPGRDGVGDYLLVTNPGNGLVGVFGIGGDVPNDNRKGELGQPAPENQFQSNGQWDRLSRRGQPVFLESWALGDRAYATAVSPIDGFAYTTLKNVGIVYPYRIDEIPDPDGLPRTWPERRDIAGFAIVNASSTGEFARSIAFNRSGTRAYLAYRSPSSLVVIDTSHDDAGRHRDRYIGGVDVGLRPSKVLLAPSAVDGSDLIYVVCYGDEQIYVVDPVTLDVVDVIDVPGGPYDMAIVHAPGKDRFRAYITVFERDAVAVLELDRGSPQFHQIVAYIRGVDDEGAH